MKNRKEFVFDNVITFHFAWMIVISIPCIIFYCFLYNYLFNGSSRLSFLMLFTAFCFGSIISILKLLSFKIVIWFDDHCLYVKKGSKGAKKYLKNDIIGFYSYDYETKTSQMLNSRIYMQFHLKDKKKIYFYDVEYRRKYEIEKGNKLKKLLVTALDELGFSKLKKNKFENVYWYSFDKK